MDINTILENRSFEVKQLLRRYKVMGDPTIETINRAHQLHGAAFMTKLMSIVTPAESNFTNLADMLNPGGFIDTAVKNSQPQPKTTGKFWSFWDNLLNRVENTGQTIGQFKVDANGQPITGQYINPQTEANRTKTIYIVAAVLIVAIVAILIIKKK